MTLGAPVIEVPSIHAAESSRLQESVFGEEVGGRASFAAEDQVNDQFGRVAFAFPELKPHLGSLLHVLAPISDEIFIDPGGL